MTATPTPRHGEFHLNDDRALPAPQGDHPAIARGIAGADSAPAAMDAAQRASRWVIVDKVVSRQIAYHTENQSLPPFIVGFLEQQWRSYLTRMYLLEGELGPRWQDGLRAMDELAWVFRPKRSPESRRRACSLLPQVFQWLRAGLESLGLDGTEQDRIFTELAKLYAGALHADMPPPGA